MESILGDALRITRKELSTQCLPHDDRNYLAQVISYVLFDNVYLTIYLQISQVTKDTGILNSRAHASGLLVRIIKQKF